MQFQIPQFIEVESKIVGPLTIKQFLYLAGAGGLSFMFFFILNTWLWLIITAIIVPIGVGLAFIKYNGQPLPKIIGMAFFYFWKPKVYIWQRMPEEKVIRVSEFSASAESKRRTLQDFFPAMPSVKKLWQVLMTSKLPIPKREKISTKTVINKGAEAKSDFLEIDE